MKAVTNNMNKDANKNDIKRRKRQKTSKKRRNICDNGCKLIWQSSNDTEDENGQPKIENCKMCSSCGNLIFELI